MVVHHRISSSVRAITIDYNKVLGESWTTVLTTPLLSTKYVNNLQHYIDETYKRTNFVFPRNQSDVFKAFKLTRAKDVRVVIFGDEPVQSGLANGLAFGAYRTKTSQITEYNTTRDSRNIKKCLDPDDTKEMIDFDTTLMTWAEQDVLLLNVSLMSEYGSHMKHEYAFRNFIREVVKSINDLSTEVVFVFTSKHQEKHFERYIDTNFHTVLHYDGIDPDSSIFEDINQVLEENAIDRTPVIW